MTDRADVLGTLFAKLRSIGDLSDEDRQAIAAVPLSTRTFEAKQNILVEGDCPKHCCILLSGWACRHKALENGKDQILSLDLAGDLVDLHSLNLPVMDQNLTALTKAEAGFISHHHMRELFSSQPRVLSVFLRSMAVEQSIMRQWMVSLGRRTSFERVAHLLCETYTRLHAVGLAQPSRDKPTFSLPLNQAQFGQIVGLSPVHVNRTLQALRADGLISLLRGEATILDWPRVEALAGFDASYLGLSSAS